MMRKIIAVLLSMLLVISCAAAGAESYVPTAAEIALTGRPNQENTHVTVGNPSGVSGGFFTTQFGNNTSDMDVRAMIHGYSPVVWTSQMELIEDPVVVSSIRKTQSGGNTVYTVTLQKGLLWNDGKTEITAEDYVFSHLLLASKAFAEIGADTGVWSHILGYEAYAAGETQYLQGIRLINKYAYSVTVKKEYEPYFYELSYLSVNPYPISVIAPGCKVKDSAKGAGIVNKDDKQEEPAFTAELLQKTILDPQTGYQAHPSLTSGPYSLTSYDQETGVVEFDINTWYKGNYEKITPVIRKVTLVQVNADDMIDRLAAGEVDILNKCVDGDAIIAGRGLLTTGISLTSYARQGYGFLAFSCEKGPQQFVAVRQAIAYAFDTMSFTNTFLKGFGLTVKGCYGIGQWMTGAALGTVRPQDLSDAEAEAWDELSLDDLNAYDYDPEQALKLLVEDGWTLNAEGEPYDSEKDTIRYKDVAGELMPLSFSFAQSENNAAAQLAAEMLTAEFARLGAELVVNEVSYRELLADHYRAGGERKYDISFMATNFVSAFDPYMTLASGEDYEGAVNTSGLQDEQLTELAWQMHVTEASDLLAYAQRWLRFQERYNELLPTLPIYSNVYCDFYTGCVKNYYVNSVSGWPTALLYAYWDETAGADPE